MNKLCTIIITPNSRAVRLRKKCVGMPLSKIHNSMKELLEGMQAVFHAYPSTKNAEPALTEHSIVEGVLYFDKPVDILITPEIRATLKKNYRWV